MVPLDEFENALRKFGARNAAEYFGYANDSIEEKDLVNWLVDRSK